MPEKDTTAATIAEPTETDPAVDLNKHTDAEPADLEGPAPDVVIVFDRNLAGGHEAGDRVVIARTPFVDGLIASGVAHEATAADDQVVITDAGPVVPPAA